MNQPTRTDALAQKPGRQWHDLFRFQAERRASVSHRAQILTPVGSVAFALVVGAIPLLFLGVNPLDAYGKLLQGAFGSLNGFAEVWVKATPLLFTGLAVAIPLRAGLWNIGAEGQLHAGAIAATGIALMFLGTGETWSPWLVLPLMVLAAGALAGMYAFVPAWLKAHLGTNEIITTLMLNYVALEAAQYLIYGPWRDPTGFRYTEQFAEYAWLPRFFGTRLHLGLLIALAAALLIYWVFKRTRLGFETKVVGANPQAAEVGGMSHVKITLWTLTLGGAMAGLAGMGEVSALQHRLLEEISPPINPYGYTGIAVALLAKRHPIGLIPAAFVFGVLFVGGELIKQTLFDSMFAFNLVQVPASIVQILQVLIIISIIGGDFLARYAVRWRWLRRG